VRSLAVLGAGVVTAAVAVTVTGSSVSRDHVSRVAASARLPLAAWGPVSGALGRDDPTYRAAGAGAGFVVHNPRQRLRAEFSRAGVSVRSGQALLGLRLRGYGYGGSLRGLAAVAPIARANRVLYRHGSLSEWYANGPLGLEQGFTLTARPAGRRLGPLTLALALSGNTRAVLSRDLRAVTFSHAGGSLSYRGLVATDARGRTLHAWLQLQGRELLLRVDDTGARYPLRVDPFIHPRQPPLGWRAHGAPFPTTLTTTALDRSSSGGLRPPPARRPRRATQPQKAGLLHLLHSTASGDLAFYIQPPSTFVFTPLRG
jgi:hypothetical protein